MSTSRIYTLLFPFPFSFQNFSLKTKDFVKMDWRLHRWLVGSPAAVDQAEKACLASVQQEVVAVALREGKLSHESPVDWSESCSCMVIAADASHGEMVPS